MIKIISIILMLISNAFASYDQPTILQSLSVGDTLPELKDIKFLNPAKQVHSFAEIKGKLIILDFWNVWCSSCIKSIPRLDSLQKQYDDEIQIVLVTSNSSTQVSDLFRRLKRPVPKLPIVVEDSVLKKLFPHNSLPHHVWINRNKIVESITYEHNANSETIDSFLHGKRFVLKQKLEYDDFNKMASLIEEGGGRLQKHLKYYSLIMSKLEGYSGSNLTIDRDSTSIKSIKIVNYPVLYLYKIAFSELSKKVFDYDNRIVIETMQKQRFIKPEKVTGLDLWSSQNEYCYELMIPAVPEDIFFKTMQQDLGRFFPYNVFIEKRTVKCLALVSTGSIYKARTKGGKSFQTSINGNGLRMQNMPVSNLTRSIINSNPKIVTPIIDGTQISHNIDVILTADLQDIKKLRKQLNDYGLDLKEQTFDIEMLIIKDKLMD